MPNYSNVSGIQKMRVGIIHLVRTQHFYTDTHTRKISEKLTFLTNWYAHARVRISG